jgi:predicted AAA+ superfamily ATPase
MAIQRLLELHDLAKREGRKCDRRRFLFGRLARPRGKHHIGIVGARGTGKTVLLRQYAREHNDAFYLSADTLETDDHPWDLIRKLGEKPGLLSV